MSHRGMSHVARVVMAHPISLSFEQINESQHTHVTMSRKNKSCHVSYTYKSFHTSHGAPMTLGMSFESWRTHEPVSHMNKSCHVSDKNELIHPRHGAPSCNTLQHTATHCNTLQHTATHCNTRDMAHPVSLFSEPAPKRPSHVRNHSRGPHRSCCSVCCSVLQCVAVCRSALQSFAVFCSALQFVTPYYTHTCVFK